MAGWITRYERASLRPDLVAGLATAAVVVPQSMAYAAIAGLPVEIGLYSASVPMAVYALAGSSRALSVSVSSSIAAITAVAIAGSPDPTATAATLALLSGLVLLAASVLRLGFVADLISAPVLTGFKVGVGCSIAAGQLGALLGIPIAADRFVGRLWQTATSLRDAHLPTLALSALCLLVLLVGKRWLRSVPPSILVVVLAVAVSAAAPLDQYGIELIDPVPSGLPTVSAPDLSGAGALVGPAVGVALIAFVESIAAARTFQARTDLPVAADRELRALGLADVAASLLRGMPTSGGMSQTAVNDGAGARSPMAAVVTAGVVIISLLFLAPVFSLLPAAVLASLVFAAAVGLVDVRGVRTIFSVQRRDGVLCLLAAAGVIALGALDGIVVAVVISSLTLLYELSKRPLQVVDVVGHGAAGTTVPSGLLVLRPLSDLHFANVQRFRREVLAALDAAPAQPAVLLLDASRLNIFEYTAQNVVRKLTDELISRGIEVWAVVPPGKLAGPIARFAAVAGGERARLFDTLDAAVTAFVGP